MNEQDKKAFEEIVGEALGRASLAWSETPKGIFDSDTCCVLHIDIMNAHNDEIKKLQEENKRLKREIEVLRLYGNKDCTAMADEVLDNE